MSNCGVCFNQDPGVHCFRWVNQRGLVGFSGCHEHFSTQEAWQKHIAPTGGCWAPENVAGLKWNGNTCWGVREKEDTRVGQGH